MTLSVEITRPDDLLRLRVEGRNLRVDRPQHGEPAIVVDDVDQPAFLAFHFPAQAIAESAYYEAAIFTPDSDAPAAQPPPTTIESPGAPGSVSARIARGSRLVFQVRPDARIPFTIDGLLDWSELDASVSRIAAIGTDPTAEEIAAAPPISHPTETETAIELPYRLIVSPSADVRWGHRRAPFNSRGRTEIWHTRLQLGREAPVELTPLTAAPLRAIWSDDYDTNAGLTPGIDDPDLGRAAMTPNDRRQIVVKTSAFHGYESEFTLSLPWPVVPGSNPVAAPALQLEFWRPYVPQPFRAEQLMLSSLGGWLRSHGDWPVVRKASPRFRFEALNVDDLVRHLEPVRRVGRVDEHDLRAQPAMVRPGWLDALQWKPDEVLDLSQWMHVAAQGRDHYVRIVYEGELLPFHNRAALVKVTERKFKEQGGIVVAHLYQRNFIIVREPEKTFGAADRGMPFKKVRITTAVTPDIASPAYEPAASRSFWVEVMTSTTTRTRFAFHAFGTDVGGNRVDFTIPMMFVSRTAVGAVRDEVIARYNKSSDTKAIADRSAHVPGQKMLFAERDAAAPTDNPLLVTRTLTFVLRHETPQLLKADVDVPQVQELLGTDAPTAIRLYPPFVANGIDDGSGVFAEVVKETPTAGDPFAAVAPATLGVAFTSDKAGGFATPNMGVSALTRKTGPLAGKPQDAAVDKFDPGSFFPKGTATLFGTFDLHDLLQIDSIAHGAPMLRTQSQDVAGGKLLIATLHWEPTIQDLGLPAGAPKKIASFTKSTNTKLVVDGRIEKPLTFDAAGAPVAADVKSSFVGKLNDFTITLLEVVEVRFTEFGFAAQSGSKPIVTVHLDAERPLAFKGDLAFVEELRNAIPPDLFGKTPSLDFLGDGIRAAFSFALPPVAVGVFALKDVSLGAALTLPFLDGRPSLDFNVSERPHPFLLSVGIFGGGGFFHLQLDTAGLKVVEAAFEFGATASVDLGVASGGVHIMAGIYFKLERKEPGTDLAPTLSGYLRMGGHLSVLGLVKLSLEFTLSFTYDGARDKAYGRATLTVQIEIVFFSVSVELTVERAFGGANDPTFGQLFSTSNAWSEYAEAFA
ncbi:MAG: hypothetical protein ROZ64_15975 [Burkholderiaceae bacterium]|jgi:hypothetical protein|nr:hypothetical protein [Burkholderiaceae bacterium]